MVYKLQNTRSRLLKSLVNGVSLAYQHCALCGLTSQTAGFCHSCQLAIKQQASLCLTCGSQLKSSAVLECGACLRKPPCFDHFIAAAEYKAPVSKAISQMKFQQKLDLLRQFSLFLLEQINTRYQTLTADNKGSTLPQAIIPIPLHPRRLRERGYNQSLLIANYLSKGQKIPLLTNSLLRIKNTPHQIGLKATQRRSNLKGAFAIKGGLPEHIALVDDVFTTGSTINEAVKVCRQHGAKRIDIWCLARTQ